MKLPDMNNNEKLVLIASISLAAIVFASSVYIYLNPSVQVFEAKVFDTYVSNGKTYILTYGEGKIKLNGIYDIEIERYIQDYLSEQAEVRCYSPY